MTDPLTVLHDLDEHAAELDQLSKSLTSVEQKLEPVQAAHDEFLAAFEEGLWERHLDGEKLPAEAMRLRMAHRQMQPQILGNYIALVGSRKRLEKRISTLKTIVDAKRSVISALKVELEASR